MKKQLEKILNAKRYHHSLGVEDAAVKLAKIYGADVEKCRIAAIAHDCAKNLSEAELLSVARKNRINVDRIQARYPQLLHGRVGAVICKEKFGVTDQEILNAISYHTTGNTHMSLVEKIVYLADLIEEGRDIPDLNKIREKAYGGKLNEALIMACDCTLQYIIYRKQLIHPLTVEFRNSLLLKGIEKK